MKAQAITDSSELKGLAQLEMRQQDGTLSAHASTTTTSNFRDSKSRALGKGGADALVKNLSSGRPAPTQQFFHSTEPSRSHSSDID